MHKPLIAAAVALAATATPAMADDVQGWGKLALTVGLSGPWRISNETEVRTSEAKGNYEVENNLLLAYKTGKVTLATGYTHDPNYSHGDFSAMEHRIRSQVTVDNFAAIGPVKFTGRVRLEARWREGQTGTGWRLRPYLKASMPIHGKTMLNVSAEPFIDLGRTRFQSTDGLDRSRNQLTVSTPLTRRVTIEAGYMDQHTFSRAKADSDDHVLVLTLSANL